MFREDDPRDEIARGPRERSARARGRDEVFTRHLALPEGRRRERVSGYLLRGSEVRTLATVGAFRMVARQDLERTFVTSSREIERLRQAGLLDTTPYMVGRRRTTIVTLTREGLALLNTHRRDCADGERQSFYSGVARTQEVTHDSRVYVACEQALDRLRSIGLKVRRVVLEQELKSDYQRFLQEPNRGRTASSGVRQREREAVERWAADRDLPVVNESIRFPDVRIEYERPDGTLDREDLEVVTENYRGAHAAATAAAGFKCHRYSAPKVRGASQSKRGGRPRDGRLAEEMCR